MGPHLTEMQLSERDATPAGSRRNGHRNLRFRSVLGRRPPFGWRHFVPCGEISSFLVGGLTGMERATAAARWGVGRNTYKSGSILPADYEANARWAREFWNAMGPFSNVTWFTWPFV
jgi:hypothetical protein